MSTMSAIQEETIDALQANKMLKLFDVKSEAIPISTLLLFVNIRMHANVPNEEVRIELVSPRGSRFLELKSSIVDKLKLVHGLLQEQADREAGKIRVAGGNNPKEIIAKQAAVREHIRQMQEEWAEMDALYKNEARKKRSKFTQAELEAQQVLLLSLQSEIEKVREIQQRGYVRAAGDAADVVITLNTTTLASLDAADAFSNTPQGSAPGWGNGNNNDEEDVALTSDQRMRIQQLKQRDTEFDQHLDDIGEGIQDLAEIAAMQGEEVKRQNVMLDNLGRRIDNVHEHVTTVNSKMKDTLTEVGRASDKLCVDIICVLFAVGFAAAFYQIYRMYK